MPWSNPRPSPICPACRRSVFPAEAFMAGDRRPYHKQCVKCSNCNKTLSPATLNEHDEKLFCNLCYSHIFMPEEDQIPERSPMQVLPVDGLYRAIEEEKRRREEERLRREMEERAKQMGGCPACCKPTSSPDCVSLAAGIVYHKTCLQCSVCQRAADDTTPMMLGPRNTENVFGDEELDPFCNFCFAKRFKMSAINIAETVQIVPDIKGL